MNRPLILLLLSTSLCLAAPTVVPVDHEQAAKEFFGSVFEKFQKGKHAELFDQLLSKWEKFYPEMITKEQAAEIRTAFVQLRENQGKDEDHVPVSLFLSLSPTIGKIQEEVIRRIRKLNGEGVEFIKKAFASFPSDLAQFRELPAKFDAFRSDYEALASSTKKKLAKQFVVFNHLDEVKGLVMVFSRLLGAVETICENLSGFSECEHLLKKQ